MVIAIAAVLVATGASTASAQSGVASLAQLSNGGGHGADGVVIDGREYGPRDGLKTDTIRIELEPGSDPVGVVWGSEPRGPGGIVPQVSWGNSYAYSTEAWQLYYTGHALAAGNVYQNKRIIQVCIWYTRGTSVVGAKKCSNASSNGSSWSSGSDVETNAWDTLDPFAPPTVFNISTTRINPNIY
jgi:hypothetical protein